MDKLPVLTDNKSSFHASISSILTIGNKPNAVDIPLKAQYPSPDGLKFELDAHDKVLKVESFADWVEGAPFNLKGFKSMIGNLVSLEILVKELVCSSKQFSLGVEIQGNETNPEGEIKLIEGIALSNVKFNIDYKNNEKQS